MPPWFPPYFDPYDYYGFLNQPGFPPGPDWYEVGRTWFPEPYDPNWMSPPFQTTRQRNPRQISIPHATSLYPPPPPWVRATSPPEFNFPNPDPRTQLPPWVPPWGTPSISPFRAPRISNTSQRTNPPRRPPSSGPPRRRPPPLGSPFQLSPDPSRIIGSSSHQRRERGCRRRLRNPPSPVNLDTLEPDQRVCHICLEEFGVENTDTGQSEKPVRLPCGHILGASCFDEWLQANLGDEEPIGLDGLPLNGPDSGQQPWRKCPVCRRRLDVVEE